jgi:siroheme synthase
MSSLAVANATRPDQTVIAARIADLPSRLEVESPSGPVLVMIGRAMDSADIASFRSTAATELTATGH